MLSTLLKCIWVFFKVLPTFGVKKMFLFSLPPAEKWLWQSVGNIIVNILKVFPWKTRVFSNTYPGQTSCCSVDATLRWAYITSTLLARHFQQKKTFKMVTTLLLAIMLSQLWQQPYIITTLLVTLVGNKFLNVDNTRVNNKAVQLLVTNVTTTFFIIISSTMSTANLVWCQHTL